MENHSTFANRIDQMYHTLLVAIESHETYNLFDFSFLRKAMFVAKKRANATTKCVALYPFYHKTRFHVTFFFSSIRNRMDKQDLRFPRTRERNIYMQNVFFYSFRINCDVILYLSRAHLRREIKQSGLQDGTLDRSYYMESFNIF